MRRIIHTLIVSLGLTLALVGCGAYPTPTPAGRPYSPPQPAQTTGMSGCCCCTPCP